MTINITFENVNKKKVCINNSFCINNLTKECNTCIIFTGLMKYENKFKPVTSLTIEDVLERIYA